MPVNAAANSAIEYIGTYVPMWRPDTETAAFLQVWRYGASESPDDAHYRSLF
jgi:hypothetical protein